MEKLILFQCIMCTEFIEHVNNIVYYIILFYGFNISFYLFLFYFGLFYFYVLSIKIYIKNDYLKETWMI